jgi:hypothetical protein
MKEFAKSLPEEYKERFFYRTYKDGQRLTDGKILVMIGIRFLHT